MKKLISVLLFLSLLLSAGTLSAFAAEEELQTNYWIAETPDIDPEELPGTVLGIIGDTDSNGSVNVKDATAIQKHIADIAKFEGISMNLADVDFSDSINIKDATAIQKWVAGITLDYSFVSHALYDAYALDERIFGKWECTTDVGEVINDMLLTYAEDDPLFVEYIQISSCPVTETYEFFDDYSYSIVSDEAMLTRAIEIIKTDLAKGMEGYLVALAKELGLNMTSDEVLSLMGYSSMDEYINELFPLDSLGDISKPTIEYYRTTPDGKLYLDQFFDTYYHFYTIEGNTMTITGDNTNLTPELYPMVFEKVE